ncbi:hypothetical protein ACTFIR_009720 [Dictyostelium discoideum]
MSSIYIEKDKNDIFYAQKRNFFPSYERVINNIDKIIDGCNSLVSTEIESNYNLIDNFIFVTPFEIFEIFKEIAKKKNKDIVKINNKFDLKESISNIGESIMGEKIISLSQLKQTHVVVFFENFSLNFNDSFDTLLSILISNNNNNNNNNNRFQIIINLSETTKFLNFNNFNSIITSTNHDLFEFTVKELFLKEIGFILKIKNFQNLYNKNLNLILKTLQEFKVNNYLLVNNVYEIIKTPNYFIEENNKIEYFDEKHNRVHLKIDTEKQKKYNNYNLCLIIQPILYNYLYKKFKERYSIFNIIESVENFNSLDKHLLPPIGKNEQLDFLELMKTTLTNEQYSFILENNNNNEIIFFVIYFINNSKCLLE